MLVGAIVFRVYSFVVAALHKEQQANDTHTGIKSAYNNERIRILRQRMSDGPGNENKGERGLACKLTLELVEPRHNEFQKAGVSVNLIGCQKCCPL
jgi:hypothetical protein